MLVNSQVKFSWSKFFISLPKLFFNMSFVTWLTYTFLFMKILLWVMTHHNGELSLILASTPVLIMTIGWVATTFVMAINLQKAIGVMVENVKINAEAKVGANFENKISGDLSQMTDVIANKIKR